MAVLDNDVYIPSAYNRLLNLRVTGTALELQGILSSPLHWSTVGSSGLPSGVDKIHYFSLAKTGLQEADFDVRTALPPTPQDFCR